MRVRRARELDFEHIVRIYNHYVAQTVATFDVLPFTVEGRRPWFSQFASDCPLLVCEDAGDGILGYAYYLPFRPKPAYDCTRESTVYVAPGARRRGVGTALYAELIEQARSARVHSLIGVLGGDNPASVALHLRFGFEHVGTLREVGYKMGGFVDTHYYQRRFPDGRA